MCPDNYPSVNVLGITETSLLPTLCNNRDMLTHHRYIWRKFVVPILAYNPPKQIKQKQTLVYPSASLPTFL